MSVHEDNWQAHPRQRISSKSWTGCTWFFPKKLIGPEKGKMYANQANVSKAEHSSRTIEKRSDYFIASLSNEFPESSPELRNFAAGIPEIKPPKERKIRGDKGHTMFEFCCSEDSMLGQVNQERGINHFRLSQESSNMADNREVDDLIGVMSLFPGADLWASIPCGPWCQWQHVNMSIARNMVSRTDAS